MAILIDSYSESNQNSDNSMYGSYCKKLGQSFISIVAVLDSCKFYLKKVNSPTGNATAKLYAHTGTFGSGGLPTGSPLAISDNFDVSTLTASYQLIIFNFTGANRINLENGTPYFIVIEYYDGSSSNKIYVGTDSSSADDGNGTIYFVSGNWNTFYKDICFYVYGTIQSPFPTFFRP